MSKAVFISAETMAQIEAVASSAIAPALALLPTKLHGGLARVHLLAIAMQESDLLHRRQLGNGPARGLWQFELGSRSKGGGVWGVYQHKASAPLLRDLCAVRGVKVDPVAIYQALQTDDVLAAGVARLLMWTDPKPLPGDTAGAWRMYSERTWRPGKPHADKWPHCWKQAVEYGFTQGWVTFDPVTWSVW